MNDQELMESAAMAIGRLKPHGNANLTRPNEELHHSNGYIGFGLLVIAGTHSKTMEPATALQRR